ncbi:MAG TPA: baseplate J/gp47 family protein, partial [Kofleriaceae bacterium]
VARLTASAPGGFAYYRLRIDDPRLDPFFADHGRFSFKAACPSPLDCAPPAHECPPEDTAEDTSDAPIDYLARDFWSLRRAILEFAQLRYPDWQDRLEADIGMMLVELMAALGDELAYYQDRVAREGALETASQRRSLRRLARLVDYPIHDGLGATTFVDLEMASTGSPVLLPSGTPIEAVPAGLVAGDAAPGQQPVRFEIGHGLGHGLGSETFSVFAARNSFAPYVWDAGALCVPVGATAVDLAGHHAADLPREDLTREPPGRWLLLATHPDDPSVPERRHLVRAIAITDATDPLLGTAYTRVVWEADQATPFELDLETLEVRGNLVPATAGRTFHTRFRTGAPLITPDPKEPPVERAVERTGPDRSPAFLFTLPDPEHEGLVWLGGDPRTAEPELRLAAVHFDPAIGPDGAWVEDETWTFRRDLLGSPSALPDDRVFTLDDGTWARVVGYHRLGGDVIHTDYRSGDGATIRFGDGAIGAVPRAGQVFEVTWRLGVGRRGNVAPGALATISALGVPVVAVTNPLAATGGLDPETLDDVRRLAPDAFRAVSYRAVRPEDYAEAAERLPWVQRAGASFRWTGSWITGFATADPRGEASLSAAHRAELSAQLDRFRQTGREVFVLDPIYADIDLEIRVCCEPSAYAGEVETRVRELLLGRGGVRRHPGFFDPDHFTFGSPLERAALEAAIQRVPGVRAVEGMRLRRRGFFDWRPFSELIFQVAPNEVIRLQNDPLHPSQGTLRLVPEGGA